MKIYPYQVEIELVWQEERKFRTIKSFIMADSLKDATQEICEAYEYDSPNFTCTINLIKVEVASDYVVKIGGDE